MKNTKVILFAVMIAIMVFCISCDMKRTDCTYFAVAGGADACYESLGK